MHHTLVLIVEDSLVSALAAERVIGQSLPGARILRAQSCFEARLILRMYDFEVFVVDVHLPDGCGLDLVRHIIEVKPSAKIIVMTADQAEEVSQKARAFGVQHFLVKPFPPDALGEAARDSVNLNESEDQSVAFTASLSQLSLLEIVQLKCLGAATTRLDVSNHHGYQAGSIHLSNGEIVHVELRDEFSRVVASGEPALAHIATWRGGSVNELTPAASPERSIFEPWQALLLHVAQQCDERSVEPRTAGTALPLESSPVE
jgi:response regulator of citrate/malate metabolism